MQWFDEHQDLLTNPFYVGGDSYAGKIIPYLVQKISEGKVQFVLVIVEFLMHEQIFWVFQTRTVPLIENIVSRWK